jgi:ABC-type nitrate/sulfonate/bicarbonate transport system permease component
VSARRDFSDPWTSWAVVVATELVGAQESVGFMINCAPSLMQIPLVLIGITMIGLIGPLLNWLLGPVENESIHWKGQ